MVSMRESAQEALEGMVKGAAANVRAVRSDDGQEPVLGSAAVEQLRKQIKAKGRSIQKIPVQMIRLDENLRRRYDDESLSALAASLQRDGLIQFPTLYLREADGREDLVCCNGHRRVLAAKKLGWAQIECVVVSFGSAKDQLYHLINANMREDVFYLDLAAAYEDAHVFGESDEEIAERVGINPRTVGWYRRLAGMPPACAQLAREYATIFNATWAIQVARSGPLPDGDRFYALMQEMVAAGKAWVPKNSEAEGQGARVRKAQADAKKETSLRSLRTMFEGGDGKERAEWAQSFVRLLSESGLLQKKSLKAIEQSLWGSSAR